MFIKLLFLHRAGFVQENSGCFKKSANTHKQILLYVENWQDAIKVVGP